MLLTRLKRVNGAPSWFLFVFVVVLVSQSSCLNCFNAGITDMHHYTWFLPNLRLRIKLF
jgi:hypothetical protein